MLTLIRRCKPVTKVVTKSTQLVGCGALGWGISTPCFMKMIGTYSTEDESLGGHYASLVWARFIKLCRRTEDRVEVGLFFFFTERWGWFVIYHGLFGVQFIVHFFVLFIVVRILWFEWQKPYIIVLDVKVLPHGISQLIKFSICFYFYLHKKYEKLIRCLKIFQLMRNNNSIQLQYTKTWDKTY